MQKNDNSTYAYICEHITFLTGRTITIQPVSVQALLMLPADDMNSTRENTLKKRNTIKRSIA